MTAALEPGLRTRGLRLQHPAPGQGDQGPPAPLPELARLAQPLQRGLRRVGAGAGRGGQGPLRAWRGAGTRPRRSCSASSGSPTTTAWRRSPSDDEEIPWEQGRELVLDSFASFSDRAAGVVERFFDERWIDAPPTPVEARRRLQRLDGPLGPPLRDAQLHRPPPRRAHPRPRARPRPAPDARPRAGRLPPGHPADRRRDGLRVRRGDRLRAAARSDAEDPGSRAWACWPRRSRARSRPSSARSR